MDLRLGGRPSSREAIDARGAAALHEIGEVELGVQPIELPEDQRRAPEIPAAADYDLHLISSTPM